VSGHQQLLGEYKDLLTQFSENIKVQFIMENFFIQDLGAQETRIKLSYYIKAVVLFLVGVFQVFVFLKLVDRRLLQIKKIIAGPA
jgi:hypothetical protein